MSDSAPEKAPLELGEFLVGQNFRFVQFCKFAQLGSDARYRTADCPMRWLTALASSYSAALAAARPNSADHGAPGHTGKGHLAE